MELDLKARYRFSELVIAIVVVVVALIWAERLAWNQISTLRQENRAFVEKLSASGTPEGPNFLARADANLTQLQRFLFVAFLVASFVPIDITLQNYPGPPRFVPLILGMPRHDDFASEERGDVVLRGCISRGNDPRWVLVW